MAVCYNKLSSYICLDRQMGIKDKAVYGNRILNDVNMYYFTQRISFLFYVKINII